MIQLGAGCRVAISSGLVRYGQIEDEDLTTLSFGEECGDLGAMAANF